MTTRRASRQRARAAGDVVHRAAVSPLTRAPAPRWLFWVALSISAGLHLATSIVIGSELRLPELDLELQIPIDVELGMTEEIAAAAPEPVATPEPLPVKPEAARPRGDALDSGAPEAGPPDGGPEIGDAAALADAASDADAPGLVDAGPPGTRLPPGSQIAVRVDMTRIRESPIAEDVRALVTAIPDWQALLEGSGIDPVTQLDRLLIATPNLQREKVVLAGRYLGGRQVVLDAVQKLAAASGGEARWRTSRGISVAPWLNADATARVIALVGPAHFTISRPEDLERLLAIAAARAARGRKDSAAPATTPADALLSMEDQEGLSLEVDGVAQFVRRGRAGIPERLRLSARQTEPTSIALRGQLAYVDEAAASAALVFWRDKRDAYARNALVGLLGLASVLREGSLEQEGSELRVQLALSVEQARLILGYVRELLGPRPAPPGPPARNP
jgi:hypothetical protein